jgi:hypothetical protein
MTSAFIYLIACSFRNRVKSRLKRLKQPRYLAGLVVGVLYLYMVFLRPGGRPPEGSSGMVPFAGEPMQAGLSVLLFIVVALAWLVPGKRDAIQFTRPEVQFLFTAPVTRHQLIHYKLVRGQIGSLLSSVIFAVLMRPGDWLTAFRITLGLWLTFGLLNLHLTGVSLSRASLLEHGASGLRRFALPALVVIGAAAALIGVVIANWETLAALDRGRDVFRELVRLATTGVAGIILWPFRSAAALTMATTADTFVGAFAVVTALFVLNYVWVVRSDTSFEEASAESAEKRVRDPMAARPKVPKRMSTPFRLAAAGRIETAILWKNLIQVSRYVSMTTFFRLLPLIVVFGFAFSQSSRAGLAEMAGFMCVTFVVMVVLMGPMIARNDLRQDLANLALLKTWPVSGRTLLRGEVLAPAVLLSIVVVLLIGAAGSLLAPTLARAKVPVVDHLAYIASAIVVAPALILGQVVLQNAIAVLLPAWAGIGASRARGIDAMGQRILLTFGTLIGLMIGLIPAGLIAGGIGIAAFALTDRVMILVPAIAAAGVILAECWVATELLGLALERMDVSAIEAEER